MVLLRQTAACGRVEEIWDKLEDVGYTQAEVCFTHIKAHRSKTDKAAMDEDTRRHTAGNEWADRWAKEGAAGDAGYGREEAFNCRRRGSPTLVFRKAAAVPAGAPCLQCGPKKWEDSARPRPCSAARPPLPVQPPPQPMRVPKTQLALRWHLRRT